MSERSEARAGQQLQPSTARSAGADRPAGAQHRPGGHTPQAAPLTAPSEARAGQQLQPRIHLSTRPRQPILSTLDVAEVPFHG